MESKVLVAYATKYGATTGIAEKIGEVLNESGLQADVVPVKDVKDISTYGAFVLGSAAYIGGWRKEMVKFVKKQEQALAGKPVWMFSSGPVGEGDPVKLSEGWLYPKKLQQQIDIIKPVEITVFGGLAAYDKMNPLERKIMKNFKLPEGDFRNWEGITNWAKGIAEELKK